MNSLSVALRAGYLSVRMAEGASEKQSSLKARLRNGLTYLLTATFVQTAAYVLPVHGMYSTAMSSVCSVIKVNSRHVDQLQLQCVMNADLGKFSDSVG